MENEIFGVIVVFRFQDNVTIHNLYHNSLPVFHFIFILILMKDRIFFPLLLSKQTSQMLLFQTNNISFTFKITLRVFKSEWLSS